MYAGRALLILTSMRQVPPVTEQPRAVSESTEQFRIHISGVSQKNWRMERALVKVVAILAPVRSCDPRCGPHRQCFLTVTFPWGGSRLRWGKSNAGEAGEYANGANLAKPPVANPPPFATTLLFSPRRASMPKVCSPWGPEFVLSWPAPRRCG